MHSPSPQGLERFEIGRAKNSRVYRANEPAHQSPQSLGWIKATYKDAIEYTSRTENLRGLAFASAVLVGSCFLAMSVLASSSFFRWSKYGIVASVGGGFLSFMGLCGLFFGIGVTVFLFRADLFHSEDMPIIFDRRHRKVFRVFREIPPGVLAVFKPWPTRICMYDWDLIEARREADVIASPVAPSINHHLMFYVRKSADDPTVIDSFNIGSSLELSEGLTDAMWEHIRRFMEEGGPHLPSPGEPLARQSPPSNWWQSLGATGFIGPGYFRRWVKQPSFMFMMHLILPLTLPMFLLWGTGNWLSRKTEIPVRWPPPVLAAIGARLR